MSFIIIKLSFFINHNMCLNYIFAYYNKEILCFIEILCLIENIIISILIVQFIIFQIESIFSLNFIKFSIFCQEYAHKLLY